MGWYWRAAAGHPPDVTVKAGGRAWQVPHLYLAMHQVKAADLPGLAETYGWEQVAP